MPMPICSMSWLKRNSYLLSSVVLFTYRYPVRYTSVVAFNCSRFLTTDFGRDVFDYIAASIERG